MERPTDADFAEQYFLHDIGRPYGRDEYWIGEASRRAERIIATIAPRTVFDAGCAMGLLVEALRERGVDACGCDISSYALERVAPAVQDYCRHASVSEELSRRYDLVVCVEVMPHVMPDEADAAIDNFCRHTEDVLFSSMPVVNPWPRHVNLNPGAYYERVFARHGFVRDAAYDTAFVSPWAVRYRRTRKAWWRRRHEK
jgi:2-polyprenyl-3-methyl-5-hydroxy-6-metoxy-1,4-benzoquinol methylase